MENKENLINELPDLSTLSTLYYSETKDGEKTQICLAEEIPALEEAAEQVTGSAVDIEIGRAHV